MTSIAFGLMNTNTVNRSVVHPFKRKLDTGLQSEGCVTPNPFPVAFENAAHWSEYCDKKNKCHLCKAGTGSVGLCLFLE